MESHERNRGYLSMKFTNRTRHSLETAVIQAYTLGMNYSRSSEAVQVLLHLEITSIDCNRSKANGHVDQSVHADKF